MAQALYEGIIEHPSQEKVLIHNSFKKLRRAKKMKQLPNILRKIGLLENDGVVNIISPFELSSQNMKSLEKFAIEKLDLKIKPIFNYEIDASLIGGFKITTSQQELDISLDNYLTQLKEKLWKKA